MKRLINWIAIALTFYVVDWLVGWSVAGLVVWAIHVYDYAWVGIALVLFVAMNWLHPVLIRTFIRAHNKSAPERNRREAFACKIAHDFMAPVRGAQSLRARRASRDDAIQPNRAGSLGALLVSGWIVGGFLLMSHRYEPHGDYHSFWRDARIATVTFALRFCLTYVAVPAGIVAMW